MTQIQGQVLGSCVLSALRAFDSMWSVCEPPPLLTKNQKSLCVTDAFSNIDTYFVPWRV